MNIVFIMSDQQNKNALGKINPQYITPNLDRLANDGVLFKNAYTPSPVCLACRNCLMTGKFPSTTGIRRAKDRPRDQDIQLNALMKQSGYNTAYVGKYHLAGGGNGPIPDFAKKGIDQMMAYQCYNGFKPEPPFNNKIVYRDVDNIETHFNYHRTEVTTDLALNFIEDLSSKPDPFFLMVSYQAPHYPEQPLDKFYDLYKKTTFTLPVDHQEIDLYTLTYSPPSIKPKENCPDYQRYGNNTQEYLRHYAAMCSQIDSGVGRIIELLKSKSIYDNTVIIYTSDHGDMQGSKGLQNKQSPYEGSAGVPMIIRYPDGRQNEFSEELISVIDIYQTCADIANSSHSDSEIVSQSVLPYLKGDSPTTHPFVISECALPESWKMIRTNRYKLITSFDYTPLELYDMQYDPHELTNLLNQNFPVVTDLIAFLKRYTSSY